MTLKTVGQSPANTTTITITNREIIIVNETDGRLRFDEAEIFFLGVGGDGVGVRENRHYG
jgi:hypothetical protein